jgi:hypothetical protein
MFDILNQTKTTANWVSEIDSIPKIKLSLIPGLVMNTQLRKMRRDWQRCERSKQHLEQKLLYPGGTGSLMSSPRNAV